MYYEESKKVLMSLLRQNGCPTLFLNLSCAEYDWPELVKEVAETVYRRKFTVEEINQITSSEKNKLISENPVQTTLHFNKRFQKLFSLMKQNFFGSNDQSYHVSSSFFRIEYQMRGAPHVHSLLWLKDTKGKDAPAYWTESDGGSQSKSNVEDIQNFTDMLVSTSSAEMCCQQHIESSLNSLEVLNCIECNILKEKVNKYQVHHHTRTCAKKHKVITIKKREGYGRLDGVIEGTELKNIQLCRFNFPTKINP